MDIFGEEIGRSQPPKKAKHTPQTQMDNILQGKTGVLFVSSGKLLQYNVSRCTDLDLFRARHVHEIKVSKDTVYVRLDAAQRGLGTVGGPEYQVNGGKYDINFWIKPIGSH